RPAAGAVRPLRPGRPLGHIAMSAVATGRPGGGQGAAARGGDGETSKRRAQKGEGAMMKRFAAGALIAGMAGGLALAGPAAAQTKWDMPTPYAESNFHTENI